jgi:hypothetical protein
MKGGVKALDSQTSGNRGAMVRIIKFSIGSMHGSRDRLIRYVYYSVVDSHLIRFAPV